MRIAHLTASPFFGGPERQMLGLGLALPEEVRSLYLSFAERGQARPFLDILQRHGLEALELRENFPRLAAAIREVAEALHDFGADVLFCHGYKPDVIGWRAARRLGIPVVAVSRGWTSATWKVRCYEWVDRLCLFAMDAVVCVSEGQATKVRRLGVPRSRVHVIRNAIDSERFAATDPTARPELEAMFRGCFRAPSPLPLSPAAGERGEVVKQPLNRAPRFIVGAAGRFSPEKGFPVLIEAAARLCRTNADVGFVLFGEGPQGAALERRVSELGLAARIRMPGFRSDLDRLLPAFDVFVLPSLTEGLPNVALEASAAGVPVVATAVGGTPEVVAEGVNGLLAPAGRSDLLAEKIAALLDSADKRQGMGKAGRKKIARDFSFPAQVQAYLRLLQRLCRKTCEDKLMRRTYKARSSLLRIPTSP
jgi:glycosyltransferase involved in cell wall biosynthesis